LYAAEDAISNLLGTKDAVAAYNAAEMSDLMRIDCKTLTSQIKLAAALSAGELIKPFLKLTENRSRFMKAEILNFL
jgi:hypothetical protein